MSNLPFLLLLSIATYSVVYVKLNISYNNWLLQSNRDFFQISIFNRWTIFVALGVHLVMLVNLMLKHQSINLNLLNTLSLVFWFTLFVVNIFSRHSFSLLISGLLIIFNLICLLALLLLGKQTEVLVTQYSIAVHAIISTIAYSLSGIVSLQAGIVIWQEKNLRSKKNTWWWVGLVPSLERSEWLLFRLVFVTFVSLFIALISGFFALENWLVQQVSHKTIFTFVAWCIFSALLLCKYFSSWGIRRCAYSAMLACSLLVIGVSGSRWVIDYLLVK